jgi:topoisomerase-4 subunit B
VTERSTWANTTHDWALTVDGEHLELIRNHAASYGAGGIQHLILEVLAYANDEAQSLGRRAKCRVTCHGDGSISVADDGRGTDIRRDQHGRIIRKPVMATKDLRFFDSGTVSLPDGRARRGMSVVAALSTWLEHTNHRREGSWTQRYEHGIPVSDLTEVAASAHAGTTVRFLPDADLVSTGSSHPALYSRFSWLIVETATT